MPNIIMGIIAIVGLAAAALLVVLGLASFTGATTISQLPLVNMILPAGYIAYIQGAGIVSVLIGVILGFLSIREINRNAMQIVAWLMAIIGLILLALGILVFALSGWTLIGGVVGVIIIAAGLVLVDAGLKTKTTKGAGDLVRKIK